MTIFLSILCSFLSFWLGCEVCRNIKNREIEDIKELYKQMMADLKPSERKNERIGSKDHERLLAKTRYLSDN